MSMANINPNEKNASEGDSTQTKDETKQWGQAILRAKTALIKPHSKVNASPVSPARLSDLVLLLSTPGKASVLARPTSRTQS